jgi:demethylspheroidene O-methyltransferase
LTQEARTSAGAKSWRQRYRDIKTRWISNPAFQRWAAGFPLTRFIARRQARALFDLCAGFVYSQVLTAFVQLRISELLANGPLPLEDLARLTNLSLDATSRLMRAAASLGLARASAHDHYELGDLGASMLGNPSIAQFIAHHAMLYEDLSDPVALLRGEKSTRLSQFWPYASASPDQPSSSAIAKSQFEDYAPYSNLMAQSQQLISQDIVEACSFADRRCLLDVGGGEGRFAAQVALTYDHLDVRLFDLAPVSDRASRALQAQGLGGRVRCIAGNFLHDPLPAGADIISLVRIIHDHDDQSALIVLRAAYTALPRGGRLLIAEPMADTPGAEPIGDAYFGFYLLAMGRGRPRTMTELKLLLHKAGFHSIRPLPTRRPILVSALVAEKV